MRIAFVVGTFPELSETFILDQITGLLDRGHEIVVFGRAPQKKIRAHRVVEEYALLRRSRHWTRGLRTPLDVVTRSTRLLAREPLHTTRVLARATNVARFGAAAASGALWTYASKVLEEPSRFDVVLAHFGTNGLIAQRLRDAGALSGPLVTVFHGHDLSKQLRRRGAHLYDGLFAAGELMLPVSEYFARRLRELGCPPERIAVQHMGVDIDRFRFEARSLHHGEPVRLLSVCRLVEKKGLEFGLRAAARVARSCPQDFRWDIVGDGPLRSRLEKLTAELSLGERVRWHGARTREEVHLMLASAHLFYAPSVTASDGDQEGVPVSIMEAAACGLPVIASFHSGIPELVRDGASGWLARERDVDQLAAQLEAALRRPEQWEAMGSDGRRIVSEQFDVRRLNAALERRLQDIAAHGTH